MAPRYHKARALITVPRMVTEKARDAVSWGPVVPLHGVDVTQRQYNPVTNIPVPSPWGLCTAFAGASRQD